MGREDQVHEWPDIEVEQGKLVWEFLARLSLEHAVSVWWTRGNIVSKKLEAVQGRVGKKLLGASI